ncbi:shape_MreD, rod shape-determining protein MreD [Candidatus Nanopelagicaceae bacterium]
MISRRFLFSFPIFFTVYLLQEGFVTQMRLPAGGFSLILIVTLAWASMSTPEIGALTGFGAGLMMDLSETAPGPLGHWTLVLILVSFVVSFLSYGDDHVRANPLNIVFLVVVGVVGAQLAFALFGLLLGQQLGSLTQVLFLCLGTAFWSAVVTPLLLPIISRLHALVFGTASRI